MIKAIKLVCFDLNKTLIKENTWLNLNLAIGVAPEEDQRLLGLYALGKITYKQWQKELEQIYIKSGRANKQNILNEIYKYSYINGAKEIVRYLSDQGYQLALISGSIDLLVEKVAKELNIYYFSANNSFEFNKDNYLKRIVCLGDEKLVKLTQLAEICRTLEIDLTQTACVGDGDNDIAIFNKTHHGITFKDSKIQNYSWKVITNLSDIRKFL